MATITTFLQRYRRWRTAYAHDEIETLAQIAAAKLRYRWLLLTNALIYHPRQRRACARGEHRWYFMRTSTLFTDGARIVCSERCVCGAEQNVEVIRDDAADKRALRRQIESWP
jgi:hypothetical protein